MGHLTLQERFTRSKPWRRFVQEYCREYGLKNSAIIRETMREIVAGCSDNQIRELCRYMMQCEDISAEEKNDFLHLLCLD